MVWPWAAASVIIVSLVSFVGVLSLSFHATTLKRLLPFLVAFAAGTMLGDVFIHLLPEAAEEGFTITLSTGIIAGILFSFVLEKIIHWHHCHRIEEKSHVHPAGILNLVGDGVHNAVDGLIIGAAYLVSIEVGIATTVAVLLHELPQEFGDFALLLHSGFTKAKALLFNFLSALAALVGLAAAFILSSSSSLAAYLIPFAAGNFIYVALADVVPQLHKESRVKNSFLQLLALCAGIGVMTLLLVID